MWKTTAAGEKLDMVLLDLSFFGALLGGKPRNHLKVICAFWPIIRTAFTKLLWGVETMERPWQKRDRLQHQPIHLGPASLNLFVSLKTDIMQLGTCWFNSYKKKKRKKRRMIHYPRSDFYLKYQNDFRSQFKTTGSWYVSVGHTLKLETHQLTSGYFHWSVCFYIRSKHKNR